jgi:hypothetical protein
VFTRLKYLSVLPLLFGLVAVAAPGLASATSAIPSVSLVSSSQWGPDSAGYEHVVGEVKNSGPGVASLVEVDFNFYNRSGTLLQTDFTFASITDMNPGDKSPFEDVFSPPSGYDHYSITSITPAPFTDAPNHYFTTRVTNTFVDSVGATHIVGTVRNTTPRPPRPSKRTSRSTTMRG